MPTFIRTLLVSACLVAASSDALAIVPRSTVLPSGPAVRSPAAQRRSAMPEPEFQTLMAFGAGSMALLLLCRMYQHEARAFAIGTVIFASMASLYGFLQGAWPLGIALGAYAIVSLRALVVSPARVSLQRRWRVQNAVTLQPWEQSRMSRMFGPM